MVSTIYNNYILLLLIKLIIKYIFFYN